MTSGTVISSAGAQAGYELVVESEDQERSGRAMMETRSVLLRLAAVCALFLCSCGGDRSVEERTAYFTLWKDTSERAFAVLLPEAWMAQGRISRPYFDANFDFAATDKTGKMSIFFYTGSLPFYIEPPCIILTPCTEGRPYPIGYGLPAMYVYHYVRAADFSQQLFTQLLLPYLRQKHPNLNGNLQTVQANDRPDLAKVFSHFSPNDRLDGADAVFSYTVNGVPHKLGVLLITHEINIGRFGGDVKFWTVSVGGASAPAADFDKGMNVASLFSMVSSTVRIDLGWYERELQMSRERLGMILATAQRLRENGYKLLMNSGPSTSSAYRSWFNALGGTLEVTNPNTRETYTVPALPDSKYWWGDSLGNIASTSTSKNPDANRFIQLQPAH